MVIATDGGDEPTGLTAAPAVQLQNSVLDLPFGGWSSEPYKGLFVRKSHYLASVWVSPRLWVVSVLGKLVCILFLAHARCVDYSLCVPLGRKERWKMMCDQFIETEDLSRPTSLLFMTIENGHALKNNSTTLLGSPSLIPRALETMDQTMDVTAHSGNLWHYNYRFAYPARSSSMVSKQRLAGKDRKSRSERFPFHIWWIWDKCFGYRYSRCDQGGKREVNCSSVLHAC